MQMRSALQIKSMIKALTEVVLPATDPNNKLAQEQLKLTIGMLGLMAKQLPLQLRFDCDELQRLIGFAGDLQRDARGGAATKAAVSALGKAADRAATVLDQLKTTPDDVEQSVRELRSLSGAVITQTYIDGEAPARTAVRDRVLAMSKEQLLRDRSWLLMQGWEPDPQAVPAIETLLGIDKT